MIKYIFKGVPIEIDPEDAFLDALHELGLDIDNEIRNDGRYEDLDDEANAAWFFTKLANYDYVYNYCIKNGVSKSAIKLREIQTPDDIWDRLTGSEAKRIIAAFLDSDNREFKYKSERIAKDLKTKSGIKRIKRLLIQPISLLKLSLRPNNCLLAADKVCIGDVVNMTKDEFLKIKNIESPKNSFSEVESALRKYGLSFGMNINFKESQSPS